MAPSSSFGTDSMRMTSTHIFFWGSFLSNWDQRHRFPGARALELLLPRLDGLKITHPDSEAASTQLISKHQFNCGEQFMMAGKAWLFETDLNTPTLKAILASTKPMEQKALGRKVHGFNDDIWTPASVEIVVASQIARAEVDRRLGQLYISSGTKVFVEGSPRDRIWGVGIHWKQKSIENERNWKGENRLGKCHGLARDEYGKQEVQKRNRAEANEPKMESEDGERSKEESLGVAKNQEAAPEDAPEHSSKIAQCEERRC
jgi:ribA/ribD-fused uncharacterized protein